MSYTGQMSNSITTKESQLFKSNLIKDWRNGMQHNIPIDATFQLFKYINISPSFTFRDIMYATRVNRSWSEELQQEVCDTTYGFYNLYDWRVAISANTTLYGFYKPTPKLFKGKILALNKFQLFARLHLVALWLHQTLRQGRPAGQCEPRDVFALFGQPLRLSVGNNVRTHYNVGVE